MTTSSRVASTRVRKRPAGNYHLKRAGISLLAAALLHACTLSGPNPAPRGSAAPVAEVVARDNSFIWVRALQRQSFNSLADAYLGDGNAGWQIAELNGGGVVERGQIVVVPRAPVNPSSVYADGYRIIPILCYHQFSRGGETSQRLEVSAQAFRAQLQYLRDEGFTVLSLDDVAAIMDGKQGIPDRAVVLTIDDGYRSVYDVAWPIIKEFGFPVTLYIYTDFVGGGKALTWAQMKEMRGSGLIDIQSHAKSHTSLSRLPGEDDDAAYRSRVQAEVQDSARILANRVGEKPVHLSYPYGNSSAAAAQLLRENGYASGTTVTRGDNSVFANRFLLHRTMIYDNHSLDDFAGFVANFRTKDLR